MTSSPAPLQGSTARAVELDVHFRDRGGVRAVAAFIRQNAIRVVYMADRASWSPAYLTLRRAGVQKIIVHDHTSGERTQPRGPRRLLKHLRQRIPGTLADLVIGVSDYVVQRQRSVDLIPAKRLIRVWNGVEIPPPDPTARHRLCATFGIDPERPVVVCACRATPEEGVHHLLHAVDRVCSTRRAHEHPVLIYIGSGPALESLHALRQRLGCRDSVLFAGYRSDVPDLLAGADLCVVPSVRQEAFGLGVLEPMARGVAVIASHEGGIPELVVHGETGLLVPPGDESALVNALAHLLDDPVERRRLGENGFRRATEHFRLDNMLDELTAIMRAGLSAPRRAGLTQAHA